MWQRLGKGGRGERNMEGVELRMGGAMAHPKVYKSTPLNAPYLPQLYGLPDDRLNPTFANSRASYNSKWTHVIYPLFARLESGKMTGNGVYNHLRIRNGGGRCLKQPVSPASIRISENIRYSL